MKYFLTVFWTVFVCCELFAMGVGLYNHWSDQWVSYGVLSFFGFLIFGICSLGLYSIRHDE